MKLISTSFALVFIAACGGTSTTIPGTDGGGDDGSAGNDGSMNNDGSTSMDGSMSTCTAPPINLTFTGCPAKPTCGGAIVPGTYWYTTGCIQDPWAQAKQACPQLQIGEEKGTVKGCLTFTNNYVTRDVSATYGATLTYPVQCLLNGTCMQLENGLKMYFNTATCAQAVMGCTCKVSSTASSQVGTGYTTMNNQILTSNNAKYDYCMAGNMMGLAWNMGGTPEAGIYSLTKQ